MAAPPVHPAGSVLRQGHRPLFTPLCAVSCRAVLCCAMLHFNLQLMAQDPERFEDEDEYEDEGEAADAAAAGGAANGHAS